MFEDKTCPSCLKMKPAREFINYIPEKRKKYFTDICQDCYELAHPDAINHLSFSNCPAKRIVNQNNWRANCLGLPCDLTIEQWLEKVEQSQGYCYYCNMFSGKSDLVLEHVIPLAKGGGTTISNIVPACKKCNGDKKAMTLEEWEEKKALRGTLSG